VVRCAVAIEPEKEHLVETGRAIGIQVAGTIKRLDSSPRLSHPRTEMTYRSGPFVASLVVLAVVLSSACAPSTGSGAGQPRPVDFDGDGVPAIGVEARVAELARELGDAYDQYRVAAISERIFTHSELWTPLGAIIEGSPVLTREEMMLGPVDSMYCALPLSHVNAICLQVAPTLLSGAHLIIGSEARVGEFWETVARFRSRVCYLTADFVRALLEEPLTAGAVNNSVRVMLCTPPMEEREIDLVGSSFDVTVYNGWDLAGIMAYA
jgi:hypothetical protein